MTRRDRPHHCVGFFLSKKGGEIYDKALEKGLLWADEGHAREHAAFIGRNQRDQGPTEGGPDTNLPEPQGPTQAQVARKGFDQRRRLTDQTISPDTVERIATMVSAVDEAYSGAGKKDCAGLPILVASTIRRIQVLMTFSSVQVIFVPDGKAAKDILAVIFGNV